MPNLQMYPHESIHDFVYLSLLFLFVVFLKAICVFLNFKKQWRNYEI